MYCSVKVPIRFKGEDHLLVVTEFDYSYAVSGDFVATVVNGFVLNEDGDEEDYFQEAVRRNSREIISSLEHWMRGGV